MIKLDIMYSTNCMFAELRRGDYRGDDYAGFYRSYVDTMFSTHYNSYDIKYTYHSTAFCVPMGATINQKSVHVHVLEIKIGDRTRTTE